MSDSCALLKRYMDEANYYAELYGLNCKLLQAHGPMEQCGRPPGCRRRRRKDEIAQRVHDALKRGDLITDPFQDARYYTGPTLIPSPYDHDRNRITVIPKGGLF